MYVNTVLSICVRIFGRICMTCLFIGKLCAYVRVMNKVHFYGMSRRVQQEIYVCPAENYVNTMVNVYMWAYSVVFVRDMSVRWQTTSTHTNTVHKVDDLHHTAEDTCLFKHQLCKHRMYIQYICTYVRGYMCTYILPYLHKIQICLKLQT